ncbi:MAG: hypothetical protein R2695_04865 [Acidimicrobiales bacterium]
MLITARVDMLESLVARAGYEIAGVAATAVNGEQLLRHLSPDVVVVDNDLVGTSGWDAIPILRAASPDTQVVLVVNEDWTPRDVGSIGAFAVVTRSRLEELVAELGGVDSWIAGRGTGPAGDDRRRGRDRRLRQDWSKVGWERRLGQRRAA